MLADVLWNPAFRPDEVESERQVILEEIGMRDDTPDDLVHDLFAGAMFPDHPLGREVLGTEASITGMARDDIAAYHAAHYQPSNVVLAARATSSTTRARLRRCALPGGVDARPAAGAAAAPPPAAARGRGGATPSRRTSSSGCAASSRPTPTGTRSRS